MQFDRLKRREFITLIGGNDLGDPPRQFVGIDLLRTARVTPSSQSRIGLPHKSRIRIGIVIRILGIEL